MEPDVSQQILAEVQILRRLSKIGLIIFLLLFATFVVVGLWRRAPRDAYADVNRALRVFDYGRAVEIAEKMATEHPQDYSVYDYLGNVYLRSGDLAKAEKAYSRSNALYPSEEVGTILDSIRKSRAEQSPTAAEPPSVSPITSESATPTPTKFPLPAP